MLFICKAKRLVYCVVVCLEFSLLDHVVIIFVLQGIWHTAACPRVYYELYSTLPAYVINITIHSSAQYTTIHTVHSAHVLMEQSVI